jgi:cysteine synthase B
MVALRQPAFSHIEVQRHTRQGLLAEVGQTPLIPLLRVTEGLPAGVRILAKAEWFNPGGSVKARPARSIIEHALDRQELGQGRVLLDSTSGNMGIAYATLASSLGIPVHLAIPANAGGPRLRILDTLGAELTLTDPLEGSDGARRVAARMAADDPDRYYYADQYNNPSNWKAHFETTGPELVAQTHGGLTHVVAGLGTTGTLTGIGRYLRRHLPSAKLVAVQPDGPMHGIEGLKHLPSSLVPPIYDASLPDRQMAISTEAAYAMARELARQEGLLVGVSSGAAAAAAVELAHDIDEGTIVVIFPDSGLKYLDEPFWEAG